MKTRILIYVLFGVLCAACIGIYFINPANPALQVSMSFGASLIGAIFVAVTMEAIANGKQKRSVKAIQNHMLANIRQTFKSFYLWLGNYLVRKFQIVNFDYAQIQTSNELYIKLYAECNKKIENKEVDVDLENLIDFVSSKISPLLDSVQNLNQIINEEIATLITNEVLDEEDVEYFNALKMYLINAQTCENFEELANELTTILAELNKKQILRLEKDDLLTDRLIRKFSMPETK